MICWTVTLNFLAIRESVSFAFTTYTNGVGDGACVGRADAVGEALARAWADAVGASVPPPPIPWIKPGTR